MGGIKKKPRHYFREITNYFREKTHSCFNFEAILEFFALQVGRGKGQSRIHVGPSTSSHRASPGWLLIYLWKSINIKYRKSIKINLGKARRSGGGHGSHLPGKGKADPAPRSRDGIITVSVSSKVASPHLLVPPRPPSLPPSLLFPFLLPPCTNPSPPPLFRAAVITLSPGDAELGSE